MAMRIFDSQSWRKKTDQCQCLYAHKSNTHTNYILAVRNDNEEALPGRHPKNPTVRQIEQAKTIETSNQKHPSTEIIETVSEKNTSPNPEKPKENPTQSLLVKEKTLKETNTQKGTKRNRTQNKK